MFAVDDGLYTFAGAQEAGPMNDLWQHDPGWLIAEQITSFPGLLNPAFVTCSTNPMLLLQAANAGVKRLGTRLQSNSVVSTRPMNDLWQYDPGWLTAEQIASFPGLLTPCSICRLQYKPRVSTASDKRWGEKAWERGYRAIA